MKPGRYSHWNTTRIGAFKLSVRPPPRTPYSILRVENIIDTGNGRLHAVLKNALPDFIEINMHCRSGRPLRPKLPPAAGGVSCVYTGRGFGVVTEVSSSLQLVARRAKLVAVVPEVMRPGDFLIYRHGKGGMRFAGVVRAMKHKSAAVCQEQKV